MKKMLIAGNWKMNKTVGESVKLVRQILSGLEKHDLQTGVVVCPPFTSLDELSRVLKDNKKVIMGAQNCHYESKGAFTGEISIPMIKQFGCEYIIIGHSERRTFFNETDDIINQKAKAILQSDLSPIICIGETLEERKNEKTYQVLEHQVKTCLRDIQSLFAERIVIAYEPVWAIGTGISATHAQIQDAHEFIKRQLVKIFAKSGNSVPVLYGGSVNDDNARSILELKDVNGALIGGASLKADVFLSIIYTAQALI